MMKNLIGILSIFIFFRAYTQMENKPGILVFGYNAYFIALDSTDHEITPELISKKIEQDTTWMVENIPGSLLGEIIEKSYSMPASCPTQTGNLFLFPCTIDVLNYQVSRVDTNCIFCICSKTICGMFHEIHLISEFKLTYSERLFNSNFIINKELNSNRFSSLAPGLFRWDW